MATGERPNFVVAFLVRAGVIRVPSSHRAWLAGELLARTARRRTAFAAHLPTGLSFGGTWLLLNTLSGQVTSSPWLLVAAGLVPALVFAPFGVGYRRQADHLRKKNELVA